MPHETHETHETQEETKLVYAKNIIYSVTDIEWQYLDIDYSSNKSDYKNDVTKGTKYGDELLKCFKYAYKKHDKKHPVIITQAQSGHIKAYDPIFTIESIDQSEANKFRDYLVSYVNKVGDIITHDICNEYAYAFDYSENTIKANDLKMNLDNGEDKAVLKEIRKFEKYDAKDLNIEIDAVNIAACLDMCVRPGSDIRDALESINNLKVTYVCNFDGKAKEYKDVIKDIIRVIKQCSIKVIVVMKVTPKLFNKISTKKKLVNLTSEASELGVNVVENNTNFRTKLVKCTYEEKFDNLIGTRDVSFDIKNIKE